MGLRVAGRLLWGCVALLQLPLLVRPAQPQTQQRAGGLSHGVSVVAESVVVALNASQAGSRAYFPAMLSWAGQTLMLGVNTQSDNVHDR